MSKEVRMNELMVIVSNYLTSSATALTSYHEVGVITSLNAFNKTSLDFLFNFFDFLIQHPGAAILFCYLDFVSRRTGKKLSKVYKEKIVECFGSLEETLKETIVEMKRRSRRKKYRY